MRHGVEIRGARLHLRLDARSKAVLERAAAYRHETVGRFVLRAALEEAETVIREHEVVTLSAPDWAALYDALLDPPIPNAALKEAFAEYEKANG